MLPLTKEPLEHNLKSLRANFPTASQLESVRRKLGHASSGYCFPGASSISFPYFLKNLNPQLRIVVILRNPIERAFSHWRWDSELRSRVPRALALDREFPGFDDLVSLEIADAERGGIGWPTIAGVSGYLKQSIYLPFLTVLFELFPPQQIKLVHAADLFLDPISTTQDCYDFLGLPPCDPVLIEERNPAPAAVIKKATREQMARFFEPHNQQLYRFLGRDLGWEPSVTSGTTD